MNFAQYFPIEPPASQGIKIELEFAARLNEVVAATPFISSPAVLTVTAFACGLLIRIIEPGA